MSTGEAKPDHIQITELGSSEPALILLSGLGDPATWWFSVPTPEEALPHWKGEAGTRRAGIAPVLALTARVVAYDRAGVGGSTAPEHDRTWAEIYAELDTVISTLALTRPPILVGHSLGGLIAYSYARRFPAKVSGLVLLDVTPPPMTQPPSVPMPERLALVHFEPAEVATRALGDLPLTLISPGQPSTDLDSNAERRAALDDRFEKRRAQHQRLLATSSRSKAVWTSRSGHYVHLESLELVATSILETWADVKKIQQKQ